jgi:hypothetical protein
VASVVVAGLLGLASVAVTVIDSGPASAGPNDSSSGGHCHHNPAAAIAAGGVWDGAGRCYNLRDGLTISVPVTIENAIFYDSESRPPHKGSVHPIIRIKDTSEVRLSSLTLVGANVTGAYHADMVAEAGIDILSSDSVTITGVRTIDTFGDGLSLGFQPHVGPSWNVVVNGLTVTNAGRQGITMAHVNMATMTNVNVVSSAMAGWDFESDLPGVGSGNVVVRGATGEGIRLTEALSGPVTFDDSLISGNVSLINEAADSGQAVTFNGGTVLLKGAFHGIPPAGVWVKGPGNLTFNDVTLGRQPVKKSPTGLAWLAEDGAHLVFDGGSRVPPLGIHDATSTVSILA